MSINLFQRMHRDQHGFTLMELFLAMAISAVIAAAIVLSLYQIVTGSTRTNGHLLAVQQVQNAGYWVSRDAQQAQTFTLGATAGFPFTLNWVDWDNNSVVVTYALSSGNLVRQAATNTTVARFVNSAADKTKCERGGVFLLPDTADTVTLRGGSVADSGRIAVVTGSVTVTAAGGATYDSGSQTWSLPNSSATIAIRASSNGTSGDWASIKGKATSSVTSDADGDASVDGDALFFTVTVDVGAAPIIESETRVYKILPRAG